MKSAFKLYHIYLITALILFIYAKCNKPPFRPDYQNVKGYVIAKEKCNTDSTQDYWSIDLTYLANTPKYGDTLILNNITYTNVVKTKGLSDQLKQIGMLVSIDYKIISTDRIISTGCNVANPVTYPLKELFIINQFEIR